MTAACRLQLVTLSESGEQPPEAGGTNEVTVAAPQQPYRPRLFTVGGTGAGESGKRSRAITETGRRIGAQRRTGQGGSIHLMETIRAAAPHQHARGRIDSLKFRADDLRLAVKEGHESNLILFCVDASGSMAARKRMEQVKTAILSLLMDAYQRRDKVGLITFRQDGAELALPPTGSIDIAATRLAELPAGGRTPLAEALLKTADVLRLERVRDPRRRPLLVVITDGRATYGDNALGPRAPGRQAPRRDRTRQPRDRLRDRHVPHGPGAPARRSPDGRVRAARRGQRLGPHRRRSLRPPRDGSRLMPKGQPVAVPDDGLTTRERRNRPLLMVHTGNGKGKSTAAFGLAIRSWNQGWNIGVFQFVKSAKWRIGEQTVLERLGELHTETGEGGPVEWHKMGSGWSWSRKEGSDEDHAADAAEGWAEVKRRIAAEAHDLYVLDEFTYPMKWGWVDVDDVVETLANRPGRQYVVITGRNADPRLVEIADLVTEMQHVKHPFDNGQKGQRGIEW